VPTFFYTKYGDTMGYMYGVYIIYVSKSRDGSISVSYLVWSLEKNWKLCWDVFILLFKFFNRNNKNMKLSVNWKTMALLF